MTGLRRPTPVQAPLDDLGSTPVTLVGHPFAPIGMGEQLRSHLAACRAVQVDAQVLDVFRFAGRTDEAYAALVEGCECTALPGGIRIFHVNGDEVERVLAAIEAGGGGFAEGYNIIVPAWELPVYPAALVPLLRRFDEVWALSAFIRSALSAAGVPSWLVGQSVELPPGPVLPRRHFGISESAFVLLTMFDLGSYASRKNPGAVLDLFEMLCRSHPLLDLNLVLKVKDGEWDAAERAGPWAERAASNPRIRVLTEPLDGHGIRSLLQACDVFVSLHRAEGFGRGLGEAMALRRVAMATGWSGNLDFMTERTALLVRHRLLPVRRGAYPHGRGQSWAEPDLSHAASLLEPLLAAHARSDGRAAAALAARGQAAVLHSHGHRAVGLRILDRLEQIVAGQALRAFAAD